MKKVFKNLFFFAIIIANIFFVNISFIYAFDSFSLSNPVGVENSILNDLGVNKDELRYNIQTMNVSRQKKIPPQVMLTFEPANPVPGQKVTITATPSYFINDTKNLYFTWYLKNEKCTDKTLDGDNYKYNKDCDLNGDGKVNIEDYKIKAMRTIASNDFDYANNAYSKQTTSNNGYKASGGGDDQKGKESHCYFHDNATGDEYEIDKTNCGSSQNGHLFAQPPKDGSYHATGSGTFSIDDEKFWRTNPDADDTAGTGNNDGANVSGLGEDTFTFNYTQGDKIGVVVEGSSFEPTQYSNASYKTMWAFTKNTCNALKANLDSKYPINNSSAVTTTDSPIANCTTVVTTTTIKDIFGTQVNNFANIRTYTTVETKISCTDPTTGLATEIPSGYQADTITRSSTCQQSDTESGGGSVTYKDNTYNCSGVIDGTDSQASQGDITISDLNQCLYENLITPAEGGGAKQKINVNISYSPQNPINDSSSNGGNGDQLIFNSTVSGAQNPDYLNYTWQVFKGDSADTENWISLKKTEIPDATQMTGLGVNSFKFKLNFTGDSPPKFLKVRLAVKDSIAKGETQEGHTDTVIAVSSSGERIEIFPVTITYPTSTSTTPTVKLDDSSADNELCLSDPGGTGKKTPSAICYVTKNDLFGIEIKNTSKDYSDFLWTIDNVPLTCPSSNFDGCINSDTQANTNKIYLPILKNVGEQFALGLSATKTTGEKLSLTRVFRVIDPIVKIVPAEKDGETITCRGKLLGKYSDLQGNVWDDRSETDFNALTGHNIVLIPAISGVDFSQMKDTNYQWIVDGSVITKDNVTEYGGYALDSETGSLTLPPKNEGESYIVGFYLPYTQKVSKKQLLNQYWNVGYNDFYEKKLSSQIQIKMVSLVSELAKTDPVQKRILATISSGIPSYVSFLFRIVLSGATLIIIAKVLFYILPKTKNYYEE